MARNYKHRKVQRYITKDGMMFKPLAIEYIEKAIAAKESRSLSDVLLALGDMVEEKQINCGKRDRATAYRQLAEIGLETTSDVAMVLRNLGKMELRFVGVAS